MHMVMMVFRTSLEDEVLHLIDQEELPFTRLDDLQGKGESGIVTEARWGESNVALFLAVPDERLTTLRDRLQQFHEVLQLRPRSATAHLHAFVMPCIQWF